VSLCASSPSQVETLVLTFALCIAARCPLDTTAYNDDSNASAPAACALPFRLGAAAPAVTTAIELSVDLQDRPTVWMLLWQPASDEAHESESPAEESRLGGGLRVEQGSRKSDSTDDANRHESTCPNASNIYHTCTAWCAERWGATVTLSVDPPGVPVKTVLGALATASVDVLDLFD
jgi:hypothetical protein